jgi:hypothetical protein
MWVKEPRWIRERRNKKIKREGKCKRKKAIQKKMQKKERVVQTFHSPTHLYIARRSCFAKHFSKTVLASPANLLHQHNHNWSYHSHSHDRAKKTLNNSSLAYYGS